MVNKIEYEGKVVYHPGYYLEKMIIKLGITIDNLAYRLDMKEDRLKEILFDNGRIELEDSIKLGRLFGVVEDYWLNLQLDYDQAIIEMKLDENYEVEKKIMKFIDYKELSYKYDLLDTDDLDEQILILRDFLNVVSLSVIIRSKENFDKNEIKLIVEQLIHSNKCFKSKINIL